MIRSRIHYDTEQITGKDVFTDHPSRLDDLEMTLGGCPLVKICNRKSLWNFEHLGKFQSLVIAAVTVDVQSGL